MAKNTVVVKFLADVDGMKRGVEQVNSQLTAFSKGMKAIAGVSAAVFAAQPIIDWAKQGVMAASDFNEALNKVNVVFGDSARAVEAWSKNSVDAMGLTQGAALEAAGTFGNLLTSFGASKQAAADMSTQLVQLAADMASFNNTSIEDAINAIRSGLSGETEPLKRFGVTLTDVRLRAEGAAQGLDTTAASLSPLTKSMAAYSLIMKDTANAQGDFARTGDGFANQLRKLQAGASELQRAFGQGFLDALGNAGDAFGDVGTALEDLKPLLSFFGGRAGETARSLSQIASALVNVGKAAEGAADRMGPLGNAIDWLINDMPFFWNGLRTVGQILDNITGPSVDAANAAWSAADAYSGMSVEAYRAAYGVTALNNALNGATTVSTSGGGPVSVRRAEYANGETEQKNIDKVTDLLFAQWQAQQRVNESVSRGSSSQSSALQKLKVDWEGLSTAMLEFSGKSVEVADSQMKALSKRATALDGVVERQMAKIDQYRAQLDEFNAYVDEVLSKSLGGLDPSEFVTQNSDGTWVFDALGFDKAIADKGTMVSKLANLAGQIPEAWSQAILGLPTDKANALLDYFTNNPDTASSLVTKYTEFTQKVTDTWGPMLATAYTGIHKDAVDAGIAAAKQKIEDEADDFKKWVKKKLKTTVEIDVVYNYPQGQPSGVSGSPQAIVSALRDYERVNGTAWRL